MLRFVVLVLVLAFPVAVFGAMVAVDREFGAPGRGTDYVLRLELPPGGSEVDLPDVEGPPDASRPLIVIDAGHGGHDPGAGSEVLREKVLTLQLARALRDELLGSGGVRVALTRSEDKYLLLEERSGIARRLKADLFLSIHADSVENSEAGGASVYTLSERGSDDAAQRMALRENKADSINGVPLAQTRDNVSAILVDLSLRETQARSAEFAGLLVREAKGVLPLRERPLQSAAFVVLKSPDMPSALFESGYITNARDAALLASAAGQKSFAQATARAIRAYFARQSRGAQ